MNYVLYHELVPLIEERMEVKYNWALFVEQGDETLAYFQGSEKSWMTQ